MRRFFPAVLTALGVLLLLPLVWMKHVSPLRPDEEGKALEPIAKIAMKRIREERSLEVSLKIPDDPVWKRIRKAWGNPGYIIAFVAPSSRMFLRCFDRQSFGVRVTEQGRPIPLAWIAWFPYGYSANCQPEGLSFRAAPGSVLRIEVNARPNLEVPDGELIITPHWAVATKDRLVGIAIEEEITPYFDFLAVCGIVAILLAAVLMFQRRRAMGTA